MSQSSNVSASEVSIRWNFFDVFPKSTRLTTVYYAPRDLKATRPRRRIRGEVEMVKSCKKLSFEVACRLVRIALTNLWASLEIETPTGAAAAQDPEGWHRQTEKAQEGVQKRQS